MSAGAAGGLEIRALGEISISSDSVSQPLQRKPLELLSVLLASRGTALQSDVLIDQLWGEAAPASAASAMRVYFAKLRSALEPGRGPALSSRLARSSAGWEIRVEDGELDISRFEAAAGEARALLETGRPDDAWAALEAANRTWAGEPFPGVDIPTVNRERQRLAAVRAEAFRLRCRLAIDFGVPELVVSALAAECARNPYDEHLAVLRARAEYSAGRQVAALDAIRQLRHSLNDDLGLDPRGPVQDLEQRILRQDPGLEAVRRPPRSAPSFRSAGLLGRDELLRQVLGELAVHQVVSIEGEAGIGKTSVLRAVEVPGSATARADCSLTAGPLAVVRDLLASLPRRPRDQRAWERLRAALDARTATEDAPVVVALLAEDLLVEAADDGLVALLDDAHLLDIASAQVLTRALAARPQFRVIMARRPTPADLPLAPRPGVVVAVPPLDGESARQLLTRLRTRRAPGATGSDTELIAVAGGNPWLLERATSSAAGGSSLTVRRALADVTEPAQRLALTLAVISSDIPVAAAVRVAGEERPVEELLVKRLAVLAGGRIRLRHDLIAQDVRREAGILKVAATVRSIVPTCVELGLLPLDLRVAVAGVEGLLDDAVVASWALAAATQAMDSGGTEDAKVLFDTAVRRAVGRPDLRAPAQLGQAQALAAAGQLADARPVFVAAMQVAQAIGADLLVKESLVGLLGMLAPSNAELAIVEKVSVWLTERARLNDADLLEVLDARAAAASDIDMDLVEARAVELAAVARRLGTPLSALYDLLAEWRLSQERGNPSRERLPLSATAVELASSLGMDALSVRVQRHHIDDLLAGGLSGPAAAATERLAAIGREKRLPQARWWVDILTVSAALREDPSAGLAAAREVYGKWSRLPSPERDDALTIQSLVALFQSHDHEALLNAVRRVRAARGVPRRSLLLPAAEIAAAAEGGTTPGLSGEYRALVANMGAKPSYWLDPPTWYLLARAGLAIGVAHPLVVSQLERHAGSWMLVGTATATLGPVDGVLAALAMKSGAEGLANDRLAAAIMLCEQMDAPSWADDSLTLMQRARQKDQANG